MCSTTMAQAPNLKHVAPGSRRAPLGSRDTAHWPQVDHMKGESSGVKREAQHVSLWFMLCETPQVASVMLD